MKTIGVRTRLKALGCLALLTVVCMAASGGCTALKKAETTTAAIAASLHTAAQVNHASTLETPAERARVGTFIDQAAIANDALIGVLSKMEQDKGQPDTVVLTDALNQLAAKVDQLQVQGILRIKNADAQAAFSVLMTSIQGSLLTLETLYPSSSPVTGSPVTPVQPQSSNQPKHSPVAPLVALSLTAEELEELISLAIAAGSALVPKLLSLRGETGPQLLADAAADDAAAEQIAEGDIAAGTSTAE